MTRPALGALLAVLLAAACRVHVTIWLAGHPLARPPVAGFVLAAVVMAAAAVLWMAWKRCGGFKSSPYPRYAT